MRNDMRMGKQGIYTGGKLGTALVAALFVLHVGCLPTDAGAAVVEATYQFGTTFAANESGKPALAPTDPLGTSVFQTDTVLGQTRTVWSFNGTNTPAQQSGLTLNTTGLVAPESYSLDMVCEFTMGNNAWRRLVDVQNRQSDAGFYVDPSNNLDIYPVSGSSAAWTNNVYHHIVLTDDGTTVAVYLDGVSQFTTATNLLNLDVDPANNPNRLMGFFLDNVAGGGQGEWSPGSVALIRLWDGILTPQEAQQIALNPFAVPEPSALALAGAGCLGLLWAARRCTAKRRPSDRQEYPAATV